MSVALVAQNKTKISFFLYINFLLFYGHKQKRSSGDIAPDPHQGFSLDSLQSWQHPSDTQLYTRVLCTLLSVHFNKQSIKKTFRPLEATVTTFTCTNAYIVINFLFQVFCTSTKLIKGKAISPLTFFFLFFKLFSWNKT